ncbi:MAG: RNA polymerase sigma factor [Saprospiraceae bacterium]|nr:RNA polymerase sigma factor [Bacteroidia bacterium]NNE15528.1 RNA polymerase sigma factor [Saprospiraceae bacterium]NNL92349.1 RNA polymerase sigma factor [Saprospiraceae bacterium]
MSPLNLNAHTEKELVSLCLKGNRTACQQVFSLYSKKMMALCYRFARDKSEAEDMLQEGFVRVFDKLDLFSGEGSLESWMRRVMINNALKYKQKYVTRFNYSEIENYHVHDPSPSIIDELSEGEILDVITTLPDGYRTVFNLYVIEGYSHKEIADLLNIGESTSRSQLVKARTLLRDKLTKIIRLAG